MRSLAWCVIFLTAAGPFTNTGATADAMTVGQEYAALLALSREKPPFAPSEREARITWVQAQRIQLHEQGLEFLQRFPRDPLRWDALVLLQYGAFFKMTRLPDGSEQLVDDGARSVEWHARYTVMLQELLAARDASPAARIEALSQLIDDYCLHFKSRAGAKPQPTIDQILRWLAQYRMQAPGSGHLLFLYKRVAELLDNVDPTRCIAFLKDIRTRHTSNDFPDLEVRAFVGGRLQLLQGQAAPVSELWADLAEVDPRFQDASRFRGKVVLISMHPVTWASETLRLEKLHAAYHAAGLEIIIVAGRNKAVSSPPEQAHEPAMRKHVADKGWTWPVVWDSRGHFDGFARVWGRAALPARILVARDGAIVSDGYGARPTVIERELALPAPPSTVP